MSEKLFKRREKVKKLIRNKKKGKAFCQRIGVNYLTFKKYKDHVKCDLKNESSDEDYEVFTNYDEFRYYRSLHEEGKFKPKPIFKDVFKHKGAQKVVDKFKKHQLQKIKQHSELEENKEISAQEEAFVNYYIALRSVSSAAQRAGYQGKKTGWKLLKKPHVQKAIADKLAGSFKLAEVSPEEVIADIKAIRDRAMQATPVTDSEGEFLGEWTYDAKAALKAVELMGKYIKMFNDGVSANIRNGENDKEFRYDFSDLTDDELREFKRLRSKIAVVEVFHSDAT